jgi:Zn-dependent protease
MPATTTARGGGFRLFRVFGIDVYVHYLWVLVALYEIQSRQGSYRSLVWNIAEYLSLFGIVLLHEFGHALACRSVGGRADMIMLWPLGGVAFVQPPPRPGAWLWSIAAGPLVNVILAPVLLYAYRYAYQNGANPDLLHFLDMALRIDVGLFIFNMLPIYPLDGGQIVQSILWFFIGQARSLLVASVIGMIGAAAGVVLAMLFFRDFWLILIAGYVAFRSWQTFKYARGMRAFDNLPRHNQFHCPACGQSPPAVPAWTCPDCGTNFDTFATNATCPGCGQTFNDTMCLNCRQRFPMSRWMPGGFPVVTPTSGTISPDWRTTR